MALRTDSLKPHIYAVPGLPKRERVAELLRQIERLCTVTGERVALKPEFVYAKTSWPFRLTLPPGVIFVKPKHQGDSIINHAPGIWRTPNVKGMMQLSKFADVSVDVDVRKFKRTFDCSLGMNQGRCSIEVSAGKFDGMERPARIECLRQIAELFELPVKFSDSSSTAQHVDGLKIELSGLEEVSGNGSQYGEIKCELTPKDCGPILKRLLTESKGKLSCWRVENLNVVPFTKLVSLANRVHLPGPKVEIDYTWALRSYRDFAVLTQMAVRNDYGSMAQSLFEFKFADGKQGQVDIAADKKGGFKFWISFDAKEDQLEFTQLTGIALKPWH
jgi:hypothetical protein